MSQSTKKWLILLSAMALHVGGYFWVNAFSGSRGLHYDVSIPWDRHIPFVKYFAPFYSVVHLVPIAAFFLLWKSYDLMVGAYRALIGAGLISLTVFLLFPVEFRMRATLKPPYDFFENIVRFFYWADNPAYNCMPSLHVALAFISARAVYLYRRSWGLGLYLLATMITISTVLIRQHYLLDVAGGLAVSALMISVFLPRRLGRVQYSTPAPTGP